MCPQFFSSNAGGTSAPLSWGLTAVVIRSLSMSLTANSPVEAYEQRQLAVAKQQGYALVPCSSR